MMLHLPGFPHHVTTHCVSIFSASFDSFDNRLNMPQSSRPSPLLYVHLLWVLVYSHGFKHHAYASDSWVIFFVPYLSTELHSHATTCLKSPLACLRGLSNIIWQNRACDFYSPLQPPCHNSCCLFVSASGTNLGILVMFFLFSTPAYDPYTNCISSASKIDLKYIQILFISTATILT